MVLDRGPIGAAAVIVSAALASLGMPACEAGVTPATTYDKEMSTFQSNGFSTADALAGTTKPTFGVVWTDPFQLRPDVVMPPGWAGSDLTLDNSLSFSISLYRPPPPEAIVTITAPSGDEAELAFGEIVVFDDLDGDGTFSVSGPHAEITSDDSYLAGSYQALVYVARPFSNVDMAFPILNAPFTGYSIIDYGCSGLVSMAVSQRAMATFVAQPSRVLPEIRLCRRTHSP